MDWIVTLREWLLGGPVLSLWIVCRSGIQKRTTVTQLNLTLGRYRNFTFSSSCRKPLNTYQSNLVDASQLVKYQIRVKGADQNSTWPPEPMMCSECSKILRKSSCQTIQSGLICYWNDVMYQTNKLFSDRRFILIPMIQLSLA